VWGLSVLAAAAIGASSLLVFVVLPESSEAANKAVSAVGSIGRLQTALADMASDERAFLLTGDDMFLAEFDAQERAAMVTAAELEASVGAEERRSLARFLEQYRIFVLRHGEVVARARQGDEAGARTLAFGEARQARLEAERGLERLHDAIAARSSDALETSHRSAAALTLVLLGLGFAPAGAAFVVVQRFRRLDADEAVEAERERLAEAQRIAHLGSWEQDLATGEVTWSDELCRLLGFQPGEVVPTLDLFLDVVHPDDRDSVTSTIAQAIGASSPYEFVCRVVWPDGSLHWLASQGDFVREADGTPTAVVGTALDITERELAAEDARLAEGRLARQEAEMRHRAYHDSLTGLPNRALLLERLDGAIAGSPRVAVLLLDLDGFKRINDSLGHAVGDRLLERVGARLTRAVRRAPSGESTGRPPDTVARLGGDEFAILLTDTDEAGARVVAERVLAECAHAFRVDGRVLSISASIGLVTTTWTANAQDALRDADVAMYAAKEQGGGRYTVFDPAMHAAVVERLALEAELRAAIDEGGLAVHYQPIVDPTTGTIAKVEALVRWPHPTQGMLPPDTFIPLAEETGLIVPLGAWVLQEACSEATRHRDRHPDLRVAVNLSARQLDDPGLPATVADTLEAIGLPPDRLVLEVTETVLMEHGPSALGSLVELRALGVTLAIDDFGTGYSSLSRLRTLPVDELKIDKSFIDEIDQAGARAPVVAAVVSLAHSLGHSVVAEGVEEPGQLQALVRLGCDLVQGYLLSKPLPAEELRELLAFPTPYAGLVALELTGQAAAVDQAVMEAVARAVEGGDGIETFLQPLLAELSRSTGLESTYLTRIDFGRGEQEIVAAHNGDAVHVEEKARLAWEDSPCRRALAGAPRATSDVPSDYPDCPAAAPLKTYAMAPVATTGGRVLGTLCAASSEARPVDAATIALLDVFSRVIADALEQLGDVGVEQARPVRVVIADDSPVVRRLLRRVLTTDASTEIVGEAADGNEAVTACRDTQPDVVLLDLEMPGLSGLSAMPLLAEAAPGTRIVVLSVDAERRRSEAIAAGASAVVDKGADPVHLRSVVTAVA
jgi:diguanylate cyclase (GGDEF)-like protein/PAS domain S-box-containing protein